MGLVLWIDANTFATGLLEKVFKDQNIPFYSLQNVDDFSYLIDDLKPIVLVLDYLTFKNGMGKFKEQYESSPLLKEMPFIIIDSAGDDLKVANIIGHLKRPFDPFEIPTQINKILTSC